jgi:hypothetical protein
MGSLERMKHGDGKEDRDDRSRGTEILMTEGFVNNNPTDPLRFGRLGKQTT